MSALSADTSETIQTEKRSRAPRNFYSIEMDDDRGGSRRVARPCSAAAAAAAAEKMLSNTRWAYDAWPDREQPFSSFSSRTKRERVRTDGEGRLLYEYVCATCV